MADDIKAPYEYQFEEASEELIGFGDGAIQGRPAGVP